MQSRCDFRGVGNRDHRVLELEPEGGEQAEVYIDHHGYHYAADRNPVGRVAGHRRQRERFVTV